MAVDVIAAALCGGKRGPVFNRAAIFRSAHEHARRELRWSGFKGTYRQAFAISLRAVYSGEREAIAEAAYQAYARPIAYRKERRVIGGRMSTACVIMALSRVGCSVEAAGGAGFTAIADELARLFR